MKTKRYFFTVLLDVVVVMFVLAVPRLLRLLMDGVPNCWSLNMGIICPACGGTRCLLNFLEGNLLASFKYNPMVFVIVVYLFCVLIFLNLSVFIRCSFVKKIFSILTSHYFIILLAVCFAVFGVLRNFIFADFNLALLTSV